MTFLRFLPHWQEEGRRNPRLSEERSRAQSCLILPPNRSKRLMIGSKRGVWDVRSLNRGQEGPQKTSERIAEGRAMKARTLDLAALALWTESYLYFLLVRVAFVCALQYCQKQSQTRVRGCLDQDASLVLSVGRLHAAMTINLVLMCSYSPTERERRS